MIFNKNIAKKTAELLLQINAIKLNPNKPFTWASGLIQVLLGALKLGEPNK